jgi:tRNA-modifying protein YgfZ
MLSAFNLIALDSLGVLRARGTDSVPFLQGQLSNDLARLSTACSLLAGYHNPHGRVIAVVRLVHLAADDLLAILPRELVAPVAQRLAKFVLRSRVKLADESALWTLAGLPGTVAAGSDELPQEGDGAAAVDGATVVRLAGEPPRWLVVSPAAQRLTLDAAPALDAHWQRLAIAAGEPQVYAATSEEFVAQMLNLDVLGAIAFDKGCYTGQEVIARAHYRGRVKRRMQRFLTAQPTPLKAGDSGVLADGRSFRVVRAAQHPDGRSEFLAVVAVSSAESLPRAEPAADAADATVPLTVQQLELPYTLPA